MPLAVLQRIFIILVPIQGIVVDIFLDAQILLVRADDVFIIIALPHCYPRRATRFIDAFGDGRFERSDNGGQ